MQKISALCAHSQLARISVVLSAYLQVEISKNYSKADWRDDLKRLLRRAGCDGKRTMFLFSDSQIKDEAFVEDINNMLNAGETPNMFPSDEKMQVSPARLVLHAAHRAVLQVTREPCAGRPTYDTPCQQG